MIKTPVVVGIPEIAAAVLHPDRISAVLTTGLLDSPPEEAFDDLVGLAHTLTGGLHAVFTVVDAHRAYRKSARGPGIAPGSSHPVYDTPCRVVIAADTPLVVTDLAGDERVGDLVMLHEAGVTALCCLPVHGPDGQVVGGLYVTDPDPRTWTDDEVASLAALSRAITSQITLRGLLSDTRGRVERLDAALTRAEERRSDSAALARTLQTSILPPALPAIPGADTAAAYLPANTDVEVVGDFYDLFRAGDDWCVVMGDVCGNGVEAAKATALARYTIRTEATQHPDPRTVLERLHDAVRAQTRGLFLTALVAMLRSDGRGGLTGPLSSAGHEPALVRRADGTVESLAPDGVLVGIVDRPRPGRVDLRLGPGDLLLLYTDGVTEARTGPGGETFDDDRLAAALTASHGLDATDTVDHVLGTVLAYSRGHTGDDTAVLAIRVDTHGP